MNIQANTKASNNVSTLSPSTLAIVEATVEVVRANGTAITDVFYRNMLSAYPELQRLFNMPNQASGGQKQALASAVYAYAANQNNPEALEPVLNRIAHKHASLGITPAQYTIVGKYLLGAVADVLGDAITPEVAAAWDEVYWQLACDLIAREARLYQFQNTQPDANYWRPYEVASVEQETRDVVSVWLEPVDGEQASPFMPGQYISVALEHEGVHQIRQYSLTALPQKERLKITVKREPGIPAQKIPDGWLSSRLHEMKPGDQVKVGEAYGDFIDVEPNAPLVLISAGVGITPMVSLWKQRTLSPSKEGSSNAKVTFIHGNRSLVDIPLRFQVEQAFPYLKQAELIWYVEDGKTGDFGKEGRLNLAESLPRPDLSARYMLCGPLAFMRTQREYLLQHGVDPMSIHYEVFGPDLFAGLD